MNLQIVLVAAFSSPMERFCLHFFVANTLVLALFTFFIRAATAAAAAADAVLLLYCCCFVVLLSLFYQIKHCVFCCAQLTCSVTSTLLFLTLFSGLFDCDFVSSHAMLPPLSNRLCRQ